MRVLRDAQIFITLPSHSNLFPPSTGPIARHSSRHPSILSLIPLMASVPRTHSMRASSSSGTKNDERSERTVSNEASDEVRLS